MTRPVWDRLLSEAKKLHEDIPALHDFCAFPDDVVEQEVDPFHIPAADLMSCETALTDGPCAALKNAFIDAAPLAHWRETYKGTDIGQDFLDRFGCYCLIGGGGPFHSDHMASWVVYMPKDLHYPYHHHPGEEMYTIIAGEAEFFREGEAPVVLSAGDVCQHASNQPHAMTTHDSPVMAYVVWRNGFGTPPVLTDHRS